jgi:glycosyltransferase involved in cell wall biosynthesis
MHGRPDGTFAAMLRVLFVNHSLNLGGSTRSLRELIANYRGVAIDLVVPHLDRSMDDVRGYFGPNVREVHRKWLPFELCYRGRAPLLRAGHRWAFFAAAWRAQRDRFYRFARDYDVIHLNSVVLHPMITRELPMVVHVREIIDFDVARVKRNVAKARGVIFIDEATKAPFTGVPLAKTLVLNNPVDMTGVKDPPRDAAARIGGDPAKLTVFAMIGVLIPEKGVDRVIRAFKGTRDPNTRLVIVGGGTQEAELRALAAGDDRIVFWGVERAVEGVFALADYVLRGEAYPCVGRTIYEALYAGCGVIIPGAVTDHTLFEYERFAERVSFYSPGDEAALRGVFERLAGRKITQKRGESNAADHVAAFDAFVRSVI